MEAQNYSQKKSAKDRSSKLFLNGRLSSLVRADVARSGVGGQAFMVSRMMIIMRIMVTTMMLEKQGSVCTSNIDIEDRDEQDELHYAYNETPS